MLRVAYNPGDSPTLADSLEGRTIDGHGWGVIDTLDPVVKAGEQDGRLVVQGDRPKGELSPGASAAYDELRRLTERSTAFGKLDGDRLVELAEALGGRAPELPKPELVLVLARSTADVPAK